MTAVSVFIMVLTLSLLSAVVVLYHSFDFLLSRLEEKVDISVYFNLYSEEEDILQIAQDITAFPEIKEVEYVSKEKAIERFTELHKDDPKIMESLSEIGDNPLPPSLNIRTGGPEHYAQISAFLATAPFQDMIDKIDYYERKPVIERLFSLTANLKTAGIISILILGLAAAAVIFNQIRMTIYTGREEIKIMRLVGAAGWLVQGPFLVQGLLIGLCGILITILILGPTLLFLESKTAIFYPGLKLFGFFKDNFLSILFVQALCGLAVGMVSSLIAVRKYLKV